MQDRNRPPSPSTDYGDLPQDLRNEIQGRLVRWSLVGLGLVVLLGLSFAFVIAIGVGISTPGSWTIGFMVTGMLIVIASPVALSLFLIVRGMGGWPGVLSTDRVVSLFDIDRADLSNETYRRYMKNPDFWWHAASGMILTSGCVTLAGLLWQPIFGRPSGMLVFYSLNFGLAGHSIMARAWMVRQAVKAKETRLQIAQPDPIIAY